MSAVSEILLVHALTGCDTAACYFEIGKGTVLRCCALAIIPHIILVMQMHQWRIATDTALPNTLSETRRNILASKTGKATSSPPKLHCLSPTEAFTENVKRAHHQAIVWPLWRSLENNDPPELDTELFGWMEDTKRKTLQPT